MLNQVELRISVPNLNDNNVTEMMELFKEVIEQLTEHLRGTGATIETHIHTQL